MDTLHLSITGMSCDHCVRAVRDALAELEGVEVTGVRIGAADVRYDAARRTPDDIADAINDAGYQASVAG